MTNPLSPNSYDSSPPPDHQPVTPSDSTVYSPPFRALFIGTAGDVVVTSRFGNDATYKALAGQLLVICGTKVKAATTATNIVAQF